MDEEKLIIKYRKIVADLLPEYADIPARDKGNLLELFVKQFCKALWQCTTKEQSKKILSNFIELNQKESKKMIKELDDTIKIIKRNHKMVKKFPKVYTALREEILRLKNL